MTEKIKITENARLQFEAKKHELQKNLESGPKTQVDISTLQAWEKELAVVNSLLVGSEVVVFSESQPAQVLIGSHLQLENLRTGDVREYTIMTRSTANPLKGVISNESPLAQKVVGLKLGNTFKFRDLGGNEDTFKIKSID